MSNFKTFGVFNTIVITITMFFFFSESYAQSDEEYKVKYSIDQFFKGFQKSDTLLMKSVMHPQMTLHSIQKDKDGKDILVKSNLSKFLELVSQYAKLNNWEEDLESYSFKIDGNLAQVWTPYSFYLNGMLSHCGANSFQLYYEDEQWKIISLVDTRRKNCAD